MLFYKKKILLILIKKTKQIAPKSDIERKKKDKNLIIRKIRKNIKQKNR